MSTRMRKACKQSPLCWNKGFFAWRNIAATAKKLSMELFKHGITRSAQKSFFNIVWNYRDETTFFKGRQSRVSSNFFNIYFLNIKPICWKFNKTNILPLLVTFFTKYLSYVYDFKFFFNLIPAKKTPFNHKMKRQARQLYKSYFRRLLPLNSWWIAEVYLGSYQKKWS